VGIVLDLSEGIRLADDALAMDSGTLKLGEPYLTTVHNFEVDGFHTYYVGDAGVWVHNADCDAGTAIDFVGRKAERNQRRTCFAPDTYVIGKHTQRLKIDDIEVGTWVLSRNEKTGEQAYRRVTKKFEHALEPEEPGLPIYHVNYITDTGTYPYGVTVTPEHPFWVVGVGWVPASELKPGQRLEICDPDGGNSDQNRPEGAKCADFAMSGKRWQATVVSAKRRAYDSHIVYNIEVEDFHTYFVGYHGIWVHNKEQFRRLDEPKA
jgi:hypothetical protein